MSKYSGCKCPACGQIFADGDDIVVCPDCGTPYHRDCWQKNGACLFAEKHGSGYEWVRDDSPRQGEASVCPACGAENPAGSRYCNNCGKPLGEPSAPPKVSYHGGAAEPSAAKQQSKSSTQQPLYDYQVRLDPEDIIDGIKAKDWAAYVGKASPFYLLSFQRMAETGHKMALSFSAFFLGPIYFLYRKAWKPAAFFTALSILFLVPDLLNTFFIASGQTAMQSNSVFATFSTVCYYLNLLQMVIRGAFAVYFYKKDAAAKINIICNAMPEGQERSYALARVGGTSAKAVILFIVASAVFYLAFTYFLIGTLGTQGLSNMMNYLGY